MVKKEGMQNCIVSHRKVRTRNQGSDLRCEDNGERVLQVRKCFRSRDTRSRHQAVSKRNPHNDACGICYFVSSFLLALLFTPLAHFSSCLLSSSRLPELPRSRRSSASFLHLPSQGHHPTALRPVNSLC